MLFKIWIGEYYSHFDRGIAHFDDGRTVELSSFIHTASYGKDSVLIDDIEHFDECNFPLRWFIKQDALDFYHIFSDTPDVLFHNERKSDIRIDKFGILQTGKSIVVKMSKKSSSVHLGTISPTMRQPDRVKFLCRVAFLSRTILSYLY